MKKGLIKVSMLFPGGEDETFDMEYYLKKHIPLINQLLEDSVKQVTVDRGVSGGAPGSMPPYIAVGNYYFQSIKVFEDSFVPFASEIMADIKNFTDSKPLLQISEVIQ